MNPHPLRLLICAYALSAAAGTVVAASGLGYGLALLTGWLGGAGIAVVLAAAPGLSRPFRSSPADPALDRDLAEELRRWEADRLSDSRSSAAAGLRAEDRDGDGRLSAG
jgi:hypothetical protein